MVPPFTHVIFGPLHQLRKRELARVVVLGVEYEVCELLVLGCYLRLSGLSPLLIGRAHEASLPLPLRGVHAAVGLGEHLGRVGACRDPDAERDRAKLHLLQRP